MRNRQWYAGALALGLVTAGGALLRAQTADTPIKENSRARLHNGWQVTPAGTHQKIGTLPLGMALSPDKTTYALVNGGFGEPHLYLLDAGSGQIRQTIALERAWNGVAWSPDGATLYVSGGSFPRIHVFTRGADGAFQPGEPLTLPGLVADPPEANGTKPDKNQPKAYVAGLALSPDGKTLYAANFATDTIYALELATRTVKTQKTLAKNAHPYCLRLSPDGSELYATQGALGSIAVLRADDLTPARLIATDKHPNDLAFAPDGRMFVSCGSSNDVLAIDPASGEIRERISTTLTPHAPAGTTPNALAFAPDGNTLFVADSDNNNVAVLDVSSPGSSRARGFIPTGWYPSAVGVSPDGKTLFLGTGKGMGTGPNAPTGQSPVGKRKRDYPYIGELLYGMLSTVSVPDETQLAAYTRQVMANTPYRDSLLTQPVQAPKPGTSPIPSRLGDPSPIKHVLYIIKENRTYDQVLGDMKEGNGDPSLTMFGAKVTPNIHALAREYVLLDNFNCSGEVSGNGHPWSTSAYGTDSGERAWQLEYSGKASWPLTEKDMAPPVGRIWDQCAKKGVSFASYYFTWTTDNTKVHMPKAWEQGYAKNRDTGRADIFLADLKRYERDNNLPRFMIMSLPEDHTEGTKPGAFTPTAQVASNDQAVGKIVAACSRSKFWKEMAIFIVQDDAQDGPDHVDAHRTEALAISPYTRQGKTDSSRYTTASMLRTMELILGLAPMSQYDAAAPPMYAAFRSAPDVTPYTLRPPQTDLMAKNVATAYGAKESSRMDFSGPDKLTAAQVAQLNRILWHSVKGKNIPYPGSAHRVALSADGRPPVLPRTAETDGDD